MQSESSVWHLISIDRVHFCLSAIKLILQVDYVKWKKLDRFRHIFFRMKDVISNPFISFRQITTTGVDSAMYTCESTIVSVAIWRVRCTIVC